MGTPNTSITKNVFTTGQAPASSVGILAIIAASSTGTVNQVAGFSRSDLAVTADGYGPLTDWGAYVINAANKPVVLVKGNATYTGGYGAITSSLGTGTSTVTATAATFPFDDYNVQVNFPTGFTRGVAGGQWTYSLDGGETVSGLQAVGTATALVIPNTGVSFDIGAGNVLTGSSFSCFTTRPQLNDTDVTDAMTALGNTRIPFEGVLIDASAGASTVGLVDGILAGWEGRGMFKFALLNTRYKLNPEPNTESEATFATAVGNLFNTQTSIRVCVGADGAHVPSSITGWDIKRPASLLVGARAMLVPIGEDPAFVQRGPLQGARVTDTQGNPYDHDEELFPTLDSLRVMPLRTFAAGGPQGVYCNNANTIQPTGGAFPYLQHIRIMNRACEIAWFVLTTQLSRGVRKNPKKDPVTGAVTIFEPDASFIESLVNEAITSPLAGQVTAVKFEVSRTDDLNAVPAVVSGVLSIVALAYIKGFAIQAQFTKTLTTAV